MEALIATILLVDVDPSLGRALKTALADSHPTVGLRPSNMGELDDASLQAQACVLSACTLKLSTKLPLLVDPQLAEPDAHPHVLERALSFCHLALKGLDQALRLEQLHADLKKLVEDRRQYQEREQQLAGICHDLRTPLNGLILDTQLRCLQLERDNVEAFTADKLAQLFKRDEQQLLEIARLVERLLDRR